MKNLTNLLLEIQEHIAARGLTIFYSLPRSLDADLAIYWNTDQHPDFREFVSAAEASGARVITLYSREFSADLAAEAMESLSDAQLDRDDRRRFEQRLREISAYEGFTCQIEMSFDLGQRDYIFDLRTEWFDELNDIVDQLDDAMAVEQEDEDTGPLGGGYYSKN